jgi:membrane-associated phospholipid phosphatase
MSTSLLAPRAPRQLSARLPAFHVWMASAIVGIAVLDALGCRLTDVVITDLGARVLSALLVTAAFQPLPLYWHRKGKIALRDSSLCILWAALFWIVLPFPVDIAARIGRAFPLRDALLARLDAHAGVNIAEVVQWASEHAAGRALNATYMMLAPLIVAGFLIPGLTGRVLTAKRILVANLAAFALGLPAFALMPAVGPWTVLHFAPGQLQLLCQDAVMHLRSDAIYVYHPAGVICFPSFHVMWAVLSAWALWSFRWVRVPVAVLATAIVLSTMTTGWHYFSDVLAGLLLAAASIGVARWLVPGVPS